MSTPSIATPLPRVKQEKLKPLRIADEFFRWAHACIRDMVPGRGGSPPQKDFGQAPYASASAWSRARNGCRTNPIFRIGVLLLDCKLAGVGRIKALQMLVVFRRMVDTLWPPEIGEDLLTLLVTEEKAECESDILAAMILPKLAGDVSIEEMQMLRSSVVREIAAEEELLAAIDRWAADNLRNKRAPSPASNGARRAAAHRLDRTAQI